MVDRGAADINPERTDQHGMTALHHAAALDDRASVSEMTKQPNAAPWMRDLFGRLPLDVAREAGHRELGNQLERLTYPQLFRGEKDGPVSPERIDAFAAKHKELGSPDTRPDFTRDFEPRGFLPERSLDRDKDRDR